MHCDNKEICWKHDRYIILLQTLKISNLQTNSGFLIHGQNITTGKTETANFFSLPNIISSYI